MRSLLLVLGGSCASLTTSLVFWLAITAPEAAWLETVDGRLLRTNAPDYVVNTAVEELVRSYGQQSVLDPGGEEIAGFEQHADAWFTDEDLLGRAEERVRSLVREQSGPDGARLKIEVLGGADMPTLIFIEHTDQQEIARVAKRLAGRLAERGVRQL